MNAKLIIYYGNKDVEKAYANFPKDKLEITGACGIWSVKDILAHITSYEHLLGEVLGGFIDPRTETPNLKLLSESDAGFNKKIIAEYSSKSFDEIMGEYKAAHEKVMSLIEKISPDDLSKPGTIPWYGKEYALDDYIVYTNYGHKKEHMAQVAAFVDRIKE